MLSYMEIFRMSTSVEYLAGMKIFSSNKVLNYNVEHLEFIEENAECITAIVREPGNQNSYNAEIEYDPDLEEINNWSCECETNFEGEGLCRHCVALLLNYIKFGNNPPFTKKNDLEADIPTYAVNKQARITTKAVKEILDKKSKSRMIPLTESMHYGKVRLVPFVSLENDIEVDFKIGTEQLYVLKDIYAFADRIENQEKYKYGMKLEFTHVIDAFTPKSREIVNFLLQWCKQTKAVHMRKDNYYMYYRSANELKSRKMNLNSEELIQFTEMVTGASDGIYMFVPGYENEKWFFSDEEVKQAIEIKGLGTGISVHVEKGMYIFGESKSLLLKDGKIYVMPFYEDNAMRDFVQCINDVPNGDIYIERADVPVFCREMLPEMEKNFVCEYDEFKPSDYGVVPVTFKIYLDSPQPNFITFKAEAVYGENVINIYDDEAEYQYRDYVQEMQIKAMVSSYSNAYDEQEKVMVLAEDDEKTYELFENGLNVMQEYAELFVTDAFKRINIIRNPKVSLGVSVTGDMMELKVTSEDMSNEELLELLTKYKRKQKFFRLKNGSFINTDTQQINSLIEMTDGINLSNKNYKNGKMIVPAYRALFVEEELESWEQEYTFREQTYKSLITNMNNIDENKFTVPEIDDGVLREYQKNGFRWMKNLKACGFGGILADDMGLGKTLQIIVFLISEYMEGKNVKTLIVCPASLVYNWCNEIQRFASVLHVKMIVGAMNERRTLISEIEDGDVVVTSYDLLKRDMELYEKIQFENQIIDEAQFIKNANTQVARAVKRVNAGFKMALTGTPIENRLSELWSIFDYLMPGFLYSYKHFKSVIEEPIVQDNDNDVVIRLQKMLRPFVLRRTKKEVLTDLPDKMEENVFVKLNGEQQKLYDANVKKLQIFLSKQSNDEFKESKFQILAELTKLRQLCCDPGLLYEGYKGESAKMEVCMNLIRNAVDGGHKILLFSQFTSMLENIVKRLEKEKISHYVLTGATNKEKRAKMVDAFNDDDTSVFCISLKAGGTGLNLTSADIVIHFDPWWNVAVENQATDRAHRIGQSNVVNVYRLIVKDTIEENITKIQETKRELADNVLNGEGMNSGSFSREELMDLLM